MRLQRYLSQAGVASRRRAEQLIASGAVQVNGRVVSAPGSVVNERDRIEVEGKRVLRVDPVYRVLLKPRECLSTLTVMGERQTLRRYVGNPEPGLAVVAPLDYPAEGVVLLTTDGELAAAIAKRGQKVPMTYHLKMQGAVGDEEISRLERGWRWEDVAVHPISVAALATTGKNTWIEMVVAESRPRALKAAGDIIRHSVLKISRVRLGSISFEGLKMGEWRDLSKGELADLRQRAGITKADGGKPQTGKPDGGKPDMAGAVGAGARATGGRPIGSSPARARPRGANARGPRPATGRPHGARSASGGPASGRPASGRPQTGRPMARTPSGGPPTGRPSAGRPPTGKPAGTARAGWARSTHGRRSRS